MKNYFDRLSSKSESYKRRYGNHPKWAAARMAFWNLTCALRHHEGLKQKPATPVVLDNNVLRIAIAEGGGMGDASFQITYIKQIRKMFHRPVVIDFYCRSYRAFDGFPFIDNCLPYPEHHPMDDYDIYIVSRRFYIICKMDSQKCREWSPEFYEFCQDCKNLTQNILSGEYHDNLYTQYALLHGKNRLEQSNCHNLLDLNRRTPKFLSWSDQAFEIISKHGLIPGHYITISRACASIYDTNHPKLWLLEYYNELVKLIKKSYPDLKIVQIGANGDFSVIDGIDLNLLGQTSIDETKVLLKYAALHIDSEGGLVHINNLLNNKSLVIFGPTSIDVFGYENNINLRSNVCPHPCEWVTKNWTSGCILGHKTAPCMKQLTPDIIYSSVHKYLNNRPTWIYESSNEKQPLISGMHVAYLGRPTNQTSQDILQSGASLMVYDKTLASYRPDYILNCDYLHTVRAQGFNAEFATPYNIPAPDETFNIIFSKQIAHSSYPKFALAEALRVLKEDGQLICEWPTNQEFPLPGIIPNSDGHIFITKKRKKS